MIRKLLMTTLLLGAAGVSYGAVWTSSYTATADTGQALCTQENTSRHGILHAVCVTDANSGLFTVYNASSTAVNPVTVIRSTAALVSGCMNFDIQMSSGIVYSNSTASKVTVLYNCY
jgi:hypothetical protein